MDGIKKIRLNGAFVYIPIAILYNAFFHKLAISINKNLEWEENRKNSIKFILIIGLISIVFSHLVNDGHINININKNVVKGIQYGGYILLISSLLNNWYDMGDNIKLLLLGSGIITIVYLSKKNC